MIVHMVESPAPRAALRAAACSLATTTR